MKMQRLIIDIIVKISMTYASYACVIVDLFLRAVSKLNYSFTNISHLNSVFRSKTYQKQRLKRKVKKVEAKRPSITDQSTQMKELFKQYFEHHPLCKAR